MAKDSKDKKPKAPSKGEILNSIAESTGLARKQVAAVVEAFTGEITKLWAKKGLACSRSPVVQSLRSNQEATPARKECTESVQTGEFRDIPAKPAKKLSKFAL